MYMLVLKQVWFNELICIKNESLVDDKIGKSPGFYAGLVQMKISKFGENTEKEMKRKIIEEDGFDSLCFFTILESESACMYIKGL